MYTIIKMIVIAVAIGMWISPRSVVIAFVLGEAGLGVWRADRPKLKQEGLTATTSTLGRKLA